MIDKNRIRAVRNQARESSEGLDEAGERLAEMLGADRVSITVERDRMSAHVTWREDNE